MRGCVIGFMMLFALVGLAQNDRIRLKNGNIIEGEIQQYKRNDSISIRLTDSIVVSFSHDEIKGFKKAVTIGFTKKSGFYNRTSMGILIGDFDLYYFPLNLSVNTETGYQINKHIKTGIGLGLDYFTENFYYPLTLSASYTILDRLNSPYIRLYSGWTKPYTKKEVNWSINQFYKGGGTLGAEIGIRSYLRKDFGFTISCGYRFQRLTIHEVPNSEWGNEQSFQYNLNRLSINLGLLFH